MTNSGNVFAILLFVGILANGQAAVRWSCEANATGQAIDVEQLSGSWYEVARLPHSDIPACVEVIAPTSIEKDMYTLKLDYINNVNKGWKRVQENIEFPWDANTQKGKLNLTYTGDDTNVTVNFVYMGTLNNLTLVCGYAGLAPSVSLLRVLSRNRTVEYRMQRELETLMADFGVDAAEITWVEQGSKCNSGPSVSSSIFVVLLTAVMVSMEKVLNIDH
ncbi:uncharacterized protein LOC131807229 [Musca domestica]|uniref:Uncharacterized protein LOC131807229 n=1 Tax=Musca domestica TaxID=7370 RepID=A0ABM3VR95_MUSDO|nr:uncharacterized protein LOC131807229 [Musca domestica]